MHVTLDVSDYIKTVSLLFSDQRPKETQRPKFKEPPGRESSCCDSVQPVSAYSVLWPAGDGTGFLMSDTFWFINHKFGSALNLELILCLGLQGLVLRDSFDAVIITNSEIEK